MFLEELTVEKQSSGTWSCVTWFGFPDVLKERDVFLFKVREMQSVTAQKISVLNKVTV